ncbi:MAG TPA: glycosyltransferase [Pyrinomonadaceae bacterium]|jgi:glycosyltransferase involved in cell wall biosynthesis|nr:glycosyltransferase [Pyrinomonadaceae bacterium]
MPANILQLIGSFNQGGSERQAVQLVRLLREDETYNVRVACLTREGVLLDEIEKLGFSEIPEFPLNNFYDANMLQQTRRCARYLRENRVDLIHTHDFYTNIFGMLAARLAKTAARIASKRETDGMRSVTQKAMEKNSYLFSHAVVVNAGTIKDYLIERGVRENKIEVIHNGLDTARLAPDPEMNRAEILALLGLPQDKRLITIVANLRHSIKNIPMFLRAARIVSDTIPDAAFVIAGEGELMEEMEALAESLNIGSDVYFLGRCAMVAELLSVSYTGVLSSTSEGFSNSILEYMAAGLPVVATRVGGAAEAIDDGETGFLVESNDHTAMAARLVELLKNTLKAERLGAQGRQKVNAEFSLDGQLQKTKALYARLLQ